MDAKLLPTKKSRNFFQKHTLFPVRLVFGFLTALCLGYALGQWLLPLFPHAIKEAYISAHTGITNSASKPPISTLPILKNFLSGLPVICLLSLASMTAFVQSLSWYVGFFQSLCHGFAWALLSKKCHISLCVLYVAYILFWFLLRLALSLSSAYTARRFFASVNETQRNKKHVISPLILRHLLVCLVVVLVWFLGCVLYVKLISVISM